MCCLDERKKIKLIIHQTLSLSLSLSHIGNNLLPICTSLPPSVGPTIFSFFQINTFYLFSFGKCQYRLCKVLMPDLKLSWCTCVPCQRAHQHVRLFEGNRFLLMHQPLVDASSHVAKNLSQGEQVEEALTSTTANDDSRSRPHRLP